MASNPCIDNSKLKDDLKTELIDAIDKRIESMGGGLDDTFKVTVAIREITEEAKTRIKLKKYRDHLRIKAFNESIRRMDEFKDDPVRGIMTFFAVDEGGRRGGSNIEFRTKALVAENNSYMPALAELRPKVWQMKAGVSKKYNVDIRREAMGTDTGNKIAKQIAKEMLDAIEHLRKVYNLATQTRWVVPSARIQYRPRY